MYSDPLALFRAAVDAVDRGDWQAAADLCDPVSLAAFRRELVEELAPLTPRRELTVDEYMRLTPDMPRHVAEYQVNEQRKHSDPMRRLREEFPNVASVEALLELGPREAFVAWLAGRSPRRQIERLADEGRISRATAQNSLRHLVEYFRCVTLGAVPDGPRLVRVLYHRIYGQEDTWTGEAAEWLSSRPDDEQELVRDLSRRADPHILTCRLQPNGTWLLLATHGFLGFGGVTIYPENLEPDASNAPGES